MKDPERKIKDTDWKIKDSNRKIKDPDRIQVRNTGMKIKDTGTPGIKGSCIPDMIGFLLLIQVKLDNSNFRGS